jgi:hypothetical protein
MNLGGASVIAVDVICVAGETAIESTEFYIKFLNIPFSIDVADLEGIGMRRSSKEHRFSANVSGASAGGAMSPHDIYRGVNWVTVKVNDELNNEAFMFVGPENRIYFYNPETQQFHKQPTSSNLQALTLRFGRNVISLRLARFDQVVEFEVWFYKCTDRLVVMDIDGTVTRSGNTNSCLCEKIVASERFRFVLLSGI